MNKVSIVIINYNDKIRVKRAIESALNQTHSNIEVVMVDDGSDKETREIYKAYDSIKLVQLERKDTSARTPSNARNAGIKNATGEYICFLDSDNYFDKDFVNEMMKDIKDVAFCNWQIIGNENYDVKIENVWHPNKSIMDNYLAYTHLDHQCLLIKRSLLDKAGHYDTRLPRSQDCDLIVRLIMTGCSFNHVRKRLFFFEKHEVDQMKQLASIHGKTLWTLKLNLDVKWLLPIVSQSDELLTVYLKAITDFNSLPEWEVEAKRNDFFGNMENVLKKLTGEKSEVA